MAHGSCEAALGSITIGQPSAIPRTAWPAIPARSPARPRTGGQGDGEQEDQAGAEQGAQVGPQPGHPADTADDRHRSSAPGILDHSNVQHYRVAHDISVRTTRGETGTEDLRQAMVHFRALFADLLGHNGREGTERPHHVEEVR